MQAKLSERHKGCRREADGERNHVGRKIKENEKNLLLNTKPAYSSQYVT
jgi:hypothetical protein